MFNNLKINVWKYIKVLQRSSSLIWRCHLFRHHRQSLAADPVSGSERPERSWSRKPLDHRTKIVRSVASTSWVPAAALFSLLLIAIRKSQNRLNKFIFLRKIARSFFFEWLQFLLFKIKIKFNLDICGTHFAMLPEVNKVICTKYYFG